MPGAAEQSPQGLTELLNRMGRGDRLAGDQAAPSIYRQLHDIAARAMRRERPGHPLQTTALVNEAYLRLVDDEKLKVENRSHFFSLASLQMRKVLVDYARSAKATKRGGGVVSVPLHEMEVAGAARSIDLLALDEALSELEKLDPRAAKIVEMKFFVGLTDRETGEVLGISPKIVNKDWTYARTWLLDRMQGDHPT